MTSSTPPAGPLRVGIIGSGAVTQAIHLPTLARLTELFTIELMVDLDPVVAETVAAGVGARFGTDPFAMIADPQIDVVAICSPHQFHAAQVIAACEAGKRAVICEKPLCATVEEAHAIAEASKRTGVPVLTATMHLFDPAFAAALDAWPADQRADLVQSTCFLPPNDLFVNQATEIFVNPDAVVRPARPLSTEEFFELAVLGLASHHIPLVRRFFPEFDTVVTATALTPFGYDISLSDGEHVAQLLGLMPDAPQPDWSFRATAAEAELEVAFPPSYVQAGSATAKLSTGAAAQEWRFGESGYIREWRIVHELANGAPFEEYVDAAVADFDFAARILAGATAVQEVSA